MKDAAIYNSIILCTGALRTRSLDIPAAIQSGSPRPQSDKESPLCFVTLLKLQTANTELAEEGSTSTYFLSLLQM